MGDLAYTWILSLTYLWFISNHTNSAGINGIKITKDTGYTAGINPLLSFYFWQPVYYKVDDSDLPSHITEKHCYWVGIAEHIEHAITFKVLNNDTQNILFSSNIDYSEEPM